jgi:hypothetical protein
MEKKNNNISRGATFTKHFLSAIFRYTRLSVRHPAGQQIKQERVKIN